MGKKVIFTIPDHLNNALKPLNLYIIKDREGHGNKKEFQMLTKVHVCRLYLYTFMHLHYASC